VGHNRWARKGHEEGDRLGGPGAGLSHSLLDEAIQVGSHSEAAEALREVHPSEPSVIPGTAEINVVHLFGIVVRKERIEDRDAADDWLRHGGFDFRLVCVYAGVDPDILRYRYVNGLIDTGALTYDSAS